MDLLKTGILKILWRFYIKTVHAYSDVTDKAEILGLEVSMNDPVTMLKMYAALFWE